MKLIVNVFEAACNKPKPKDRLWVFSTGDDRPIERQLPMEITLAKPIAPGFQRSFTVGTDEPVDKREDGTYFSTAVVEGDSSAPVIDSQTEKSVSGWINGDNTLGDKAVSIKADGHIGDGDVPIELIVRYTVAHKDATEFVGFKEGEQPDRPIS